jgi:hypothetical protein
MAANPEVSSILTRMQEDATYTQPVMSNPAATFQKAGVQLKPADEAGFNEFAKQKLGATTSMSFKCDLCQVGCYGIAAAIVAIGAAGLTLLTEGSDVVVALAAFAGVSTASALAFIQSLVAAVESGVSAVVDSICNWTGAC